MTSEPLLRIEELEVRFATSKGDATVVDNVDLQVNKGEFFGLIGETGAGKSITAWAAMGLVPTPGKITHGAVHFDGQDLLLADEEALQRIRGRDLSAIVQNPRAALNPMLSIGRQIANAYRAHNDVPKKDAMQRAVEALRSVGIADAPSRANSYPHQLSGGMAQRALIALAMVNRPRLLIADEPTTGLDVTIQAEILDLMVELVTSQGSSIWLITHDLGVIANYSERAAVMFAGQIIESGATRDLFQSPRHPYTAGLVRAFGDDQGGSADIAGSPPELVDRPPGCQFAYRCPLVEDACRKIRPSLEIIEPGHDVRCLVASRIAAESTR